MINGVRQFIKSSDGDIAFCRKGNRYVSNGNFQLDMGGNITNGVGRSIKLSAERPLDSWDILLSLQRISGDSLQMVRNHIGRDIIFGRF